MKKILILMVILAMVLVMFMPLTDLIVNAKDINTDIITYEPLFNNIRIDVPSDFNPMNGVTGGSGTEIDPYIIEGWEIDSSMFTGSSIYIRVPNTYVIIRDCHLMYANIGQSPYDTNYAGIGLRNCNNITINNCIIENTTGGGGYGIYTDTCENITVTNCTIVNTRYGIKYFNSGDNFVTTNNNIAYINSRGLEASDGDNHTVSWNVIHDTRNALVYGGAYTEISNNTCYDNYPYFGLNTAGMSNGKVCFNNFIHNGVGLYFLATSNCTIFNNTIQDNDEGIRVLSAKYDHVFFNRFIDNTQQFNFISAYPYWWNETYTNGGGNYWSDYTGTDIYHGEDQDILGRDYIGDTPYVIGTILDYYPLINASGWVNLTIPKVANLIVDDDYVHITFFEYMNTTENGITLLNGTTWDWSWNSSFELIIPINNLTGNTTYPLNITAFLSKDGYIMEDFNGTFITKAPINILPVEPPVEPPEMETITFSQTILLILISLIPFLIWWLIIKILMDTINKTLGEKR